MKRKKLAGCVVALVAVPVLVVAAEPFVLDRIAGASRRAPEAMERELSPAARALYDRAHEGIDPARRIDVHTHVAGVGACGSGCSVSSEMRSWLHPWKHAQFLVYAHAGGITDFERGDEQFVERLRALVRADSRHGRHGLLAFDQRYDVDGVVDVEGSQMHVPNDWVFELCARDPDLFVPVCSVHPYRKDAILELERCAKLGARLCKWLPNAMGIDPADARCDAFYAKLAELHVALLTHTGEEKAVDAEGAQDLGNPLRLRRALERGATVVMAHCASLGDGVDLDDPSGRSVANFELFLRLMAEPKWKGKLFGEISALILANRDPSVLRALLEHEELHERLVDGSDYPLPAIRVIWSTEKLAEAGLITEEESKALEEVYDFDPLAFDFVLKRTLRHPVTKKGFPAEVFMTRPEIGM